MATKSFLKNLVIKDTNKFIKALEKAKNKKAKVVNFEETVEEIKDPEKIRELFLLTKCLKDDIKKE